MDRAFIGICNSQRCSRCIAENPPDIRAQRRTSRFLISAFVVMFTIAVCILITRKIKYKNSSESNISFKFKLSHILILLGAGVSLGFAHVVNLFLSGKLPAAVLFPIINICPLVLTTAAATVIFRERLSTKRWIGLAVGILSTLFVGGVIAF